MTKPINITFEGKYVLHISKNDEGIFTSVIILKKEGEHHTPIIDFPVNVIQDNKNIGIELEFTSDEIFNNLENHKSGSSIEALLDKAEKGYNEFNAKYANEIKEAKHNLAKNLDEDKDYLDKAKVMSSHQKKYIVK